MAPRTSSTLCFKLVCSTFTCLTPFLIKINRHLSAIRSPDYFKRARDRTLRADGITDRTIGAVAHTSDERPFCSHLHRTGGTAFNAGATSVAQRLVDLRQCPIFHKKRPPFYHIV
jgi:hypothetical protein